MYLAFYEGQFVIKRIIDDSTDRRWLHKINQEFYQFSIDISDPPCIQDLSHEN